MDVGTQGTLLWSPASFTLAAQLRHDQAVSLLLREHRVGLDPACLDRRVWHPPHDWRHITEWIGVHLGVFAEVERERLIEHNALRDL